MEAPRAAATKADARISRSGPTEQTSTEVVAARSLAAANNSGTMSRVDASSTV